MNVRDLVPWSRGDRERSPATRSGYLGPVMSLHREMNRIFDDMMRFALADLRLKSLTVIHAGSDSFKLSKDIHAISARELTEKVRPLR